MDVVMETLIIERLVWISCHGMCLSCNMLFYTILRHMFFNSEHLVAKLDFSITHWIT